MGVTSSTALVPDEGSSVDNVISHATNHTQEEKHGSTNSIKKDITVCPKQKSDSCSQTNGEDISSLSSVDTDNYESCSENEKEEVLKENYISNVTDRNEIDCIANNITSTSTHSGKYQTSSTIADRKNKELREKFVLAENRLTNSHYRDDGQCENCPTQEDNYSHENDIEIHIQEISPNDISDSNDSIYVPVVNVSLDNDMSMIVRPKILTAHQVKKIEKEHAIQTSKYSFWNEHVEVQHSGTGTSLISSSLHGRKTTTNGMNQYYEEFRKKSQSVLTKGKSDSGTQVMNEMKKTFIRNNPSHDSGERNPSLEYTSETKRPVTKMSPTNQYSVYINNHVVRLKFKCRKTKSNTDNRIRYALYRTHQKSPQQSVNTNVSVGTYEEENAHTENSLSNSDELRTECNYPIPKLSQESSRDQSNSYYKNKFSSITNEKSISSMNQKGKKYGSNYNNSNQQHQQSKSKSSVSNKVIYSQIYSHKISEQHKRRLKRRMTSDVVDNRRFLHSMKSNETDVHIAAKSQLVSKSERRNSNTKRSDNQRDLKDSDVLSDDDLSNYEFNNDLRTGISTVTRRPVTTASGKKETVKRKSRNKKITAAAVPDIKTAKHITTNDTTENRNGSVVDKETNGNENKPGTNNLDHYLQETLLQSEILNTRRIYNPLFHDNPKTFTLPKRNSHGYRRRKTPLCSDNRCHQTKEISEQDINSESSLNSVSNDAEKTARYRTYRRLVTDECSDNRLKGHSESSSAVAISNQNITIDELEKNGVSTGPGEEHSKSVVGEEDGLNRGLTSERAVWTYKDWVNWSNIEMNKGSSSGLERSQGPNTVLLIDVSSSMGTSHEEVISLSGQIVQGIGSIAERRGLEENIGIVVLGNNTRVVKHLTSDYIGLLSTISRIKLGGPSPLVGGLLLALATIFGNDGKALAIFQRRAIPPRLILLSDGRPTSLNMLTGSDEDKLDGLFALEMQIEIQTVLDHYKARGVHITCVPMGNPDQSMLEMFAKETKGEIVLPVHIGKLINTNRNKVMGYELARTCCTRVTGYDSVRHHLHFKSIMNRDESYLENFEELVQYAKEYDEGDDSDEEEGFYTIRNLGLPILGTRVRRGRDWSHGDEDDEGVGTIISHRKDGLTWVYWDCGIRNKYHCGKNFLYEIEVTDETRKLKAGEMLSIGCLVQRGLNWNIKDDDLADPGSYGVVISTSDDGTVIIAWQSNNLHRHKHGADGLFEIEVSVRDTMPEPFLQTFQTNGSRQQKSEHIMQHTEKREDKKGQRELTVEEMNERNKSVGSIKHSTEHQRGRLSNSLSNDETNDIFSVANADSSVEGVQNRKHETMHVSNTGKKLTSSVHNEHKEMEKANNCVESKNTEISKDSQDVKQIYTWQYQSSDERWVNYDEEMKEKINEAFSCGQRTVIITRQEMRFRISFPQMMEYHLMDKTSTAIRHV